MDFLEEDEVRKDEVDAVSFSELLNFCSRAQSLISELLLLSGRIPPHFLDRRYHPILFDLRYFESPDDFDMRIDGNSELEALEDQLRQSCSEFMQRFFLLANGIVSYYQELLMYLNDLQEGVNVQSTLEKVMENESGRQLLMESITLFGCLLLLLEHCLGGSLREKLVVSYVRHSCCFDDPNLDKISSLCRMHLSDGPLHQVHLSSMISVTKAEDLFARFPFPKQVVEAVICRLRDDDLYNRVRHYSDPEHQTVSLGAQGACLYIMLFFSPDLLQNVFVMHEIVERFFKDCWVIPIFLQFTVDLLSSWDAYKAAKTSLSSCLSAASVRDISQFHCTKVKGLLLELDSVLFDGIMTRDYVLRNSQSLVSLVRNCNVSLRWLLLHRSSIDKKLREVVTSVGTAHQVEEDTLLMLLFKTSQLEFMLKQFYVELLDGKETLWLESRSHALACMRELSEYCSRLPALTWKIKDEDLMKWFTKLSTEVRSINYMQTGSAGRKIHHVISLLKEVEQFHQVDENSQIKRHLFGIQNYLQDMLRILNLHQEALFSLSVIADVSYAWELVGHYDGLLKMIEKDLSIVLNLHSFILKFRSILEIPLMHIIQAHSQDHFSVADHYSLEYVARVCKTLEIIPAMLFRILNDVLSTLQPSHFLNRIERDKLQDLMQLDQQFSLAKAGNSISLITKGIQIMSNSFHGLINLDMKNWLEKEIRKEFSKQFKDKLTSLFSSPNVGLEELETRLKIMKDYVLSQLHLVECFQDLIHIHLHHVWEEEFTCILKHSVQDEFDNYVRKGKHDSVAGPLKLNDFSMSKTFLGHLLYHMLNLSNPSCSMYIEPMSGWFDADGHELLGLRFFDLLESCIGPFGMAGIDSLLTFLITDHLENMMRVSNYLLDTKCMEELKKLDTSLGHSTSLPLVGCSAYKHMVKIVDTMWEPWVDSLACIGQLQLLRCLISSKLESACKVKAGVVSFAVEGMIAPVSSQSEMAQRSVTSGKVANKDDGTKEQFFQDLIKQGTLCGFCSPLQTFYIQKDPPAFLGICVSIMSISQLSRYIFDTHLGTLTSQMKKTSLDFSPLVIGIGTFLRQFHSSYTIQYVQYMAQYIRTATVAAFGTLHEPPRGSVDPSSEVLKSAFWLIYFCNHMGVSKDLLDSCLTSSLFAVLQP